MSGLYVAVEAALVAGTCRPINFTSPAISLTERTPSPRQERAGQERVRHDARCSRSVQAESPQSGSAGIGIRSTSRPSRRRAAISLREKTSSFQAGVTPADIALAYCFRQASRRRLIMDEAATTRVCSWRNWPAFHKIAMRAVALVLLPSFLWSWICHRPFRPDAEDLHVPPPSGSFRSLAP